MGSLGSGLVGLGCRTRRPLLNIIAQAREILSEEAGQGRTVFKGWTGPTIDRKAEFAPGSVTRGSADSGKSQLARAWPEPAHWGQAGRLISGGWRSETGMPSLTMDDWALKSTQKSILSKPSGWGASSF